MARGSKSQDAGTAWDTMPLWMSRFATAVFARLPAEEAVTYAGTAYHVLRTLTLEEAEIVFRESWLDPASYTVLRTWQLRLQAGAFAGVLPEQVLQQSLDMVLRGIDAARPTRSLRTTTPTWHPGRFAHMPSAVR
jgi:hypothetical protein